MQTRRGDGHVSHVRFYALLVSCAVAFVGYSLYAATLLRASDTISTSAPSATSTHAIQFTTVGAVPVSGRIVITPQAGAFTIPLGLDYTDMDLAISTGGPYTDRTLSTAASATEEGVTVASGTSGSITITLGGGAIAAGSIVRIDIGGNADYQNVGDQFITNPSAPGSYKMVVATRDASNNAIDSSQTMVAIVTPVSVTAASENVAPIRSNGLPSGTIAAGNDQIEISLETNELSTCRYATTTAIAYASMANGFQTIGSLTFFANVTGHADNTTYTYYVRCADVYGLANSDDYPITFTLDVTPISNTSILVQGSSGTGGVGPFPEGSSFLYLASLTLSGYTSPGSVVTLLKDGKSQGTVSSNASGKFSGTISNMQRGTYSFSAYVTDGAGRKSAPFSTTMTLVQGTKNTVSDALLPPTIALAEEAAVPGSDVRVIGETAPGGTVELALYSRSGAPHSYTTTLASADSGGLGTWEIVIPAQDVARGSYSVRARTSLSAQVQSEWSGFLALGVGEGATTGLIGDINGDGKVNLVDFSIMLSAWGSDEPSADLNSDGIVNLADFSILLFNWTG